MGSIRVRLLLHTHGCAAGKWRIERWDMTRACLPFSLPPTQWWDAVEPRAAVLQTPRDDSAARGDALVGVLWVMYRGEMRVFALTVCTYCVIHSSSSIAPHARLCCWEVAH